MPRKKKMCPKCGSNDIWRIAYGYFPNFVAKELKKDKVRLGGCVVSSDSPKWECGDCLYCWGIL